MELAKHVTTSFRKREIANLFLVELEKHLADLISGKAENSLEIKELADKLFINPNHLSDTIKEVLGQSPCAIYEARLVDIAKELLMNSHLSIAEVARTLTYDPSNFTKFFKRFAGSTPSQFRQQALLDLEARKTEVFTI